MNALKLILSLCDRYIGVLFFKKLITSNNCRDRLRDALRDRKDKSTVQGEQGSGTS